MQVIEIIRLSSSMEYGMQGVMRVNKRPFCVTLEYPYSINFNAIYSLPPGLYKCARYESAIAGDTFQVLGLNGEAHMIFAHGCHLKDAKYRIVLGGSFGKPDSHILVMYSQEIFKLFMHQLKDEAQLSLSIFDCF